MPREQANLLHDGFRNLEQGIDYGLPEHLLPGNQASYAINTTMRGGSLSCRPGYAKRVLTFPAQTLPDASTLTGAAKKSAFEGGLFQGAGFFSPPSGYPSLVASISGRLYSIGILNGFKVTDITPWTGTTVDPNSAINPMAWMLQAEAFLLVQNDQQAAIIWDGANVRRANALQNEVPTGSCMAYYMGRLWVSKGRNYWASDLVGSSSGTSTYSYKDAILKYTENEFLAGGGSFTVPLKDNITALHPIATLNTALGHTEMAIFTPSGVVVVSVPTDRTQWQNLDTPLQRFAQMTQGALCGVVSAHGDIWYRSSDGFRSLKLAVRNWEDWGDVPASGEIEPILANDSEHLLGYGSSAVFDNRFLHTVMPIQTVRGVAHKGLAVLDFNLISRMRAKTAPAWEGVWTGLRVLKLVYAEIGTVKRCFAFTVSSDNRIELWEITKNDTTDNGTAITWTTDLRRMDFKVPETFKQLSGGDLWVDKIKGTTTFTVYYRSDRNPNWQTWHTWSECATVERCTADCADLDNRQPQFRPNMQLPEPADTCDDLTGRPFRTAYEFQPRLVIQGHCVVSKLHLEAKALPPETLPAAPCLTTAACKTLTACQSDQYGAISSSDDGIVTA